MDAISIGNTIATLRKKSQLTQTDLAECLGISCKTVSKWENGQGYPDITMFPKMASVFGVTVDYLMLGERKSIVIAGTTLADVVKNIDNYPSIAMMAHISDVSYAVGGCMPNTSINLAKIDSSIPITVLGNVSNDDRGKYILSQLNKYGINTDKVSIIDDEETGFCDVMSIPSGERTFFLKRGANTKFSPENIDLDSLNCAILHIGYIFLLDMFDQPDDEYGTVMARFLHDAQAKGIKTSIDVVSDSEADYRKFVGSALKYCNYVIINEVECCSIFGYEPYDSDGNINIPIIRKAMNQMADIGVKDKIIIHSKKISFSLDAQTREFNQSYSLDVPRELFKGSVGAGDAFCAASLYGLYNEFSDLEILEFASAAAVCNLFEANSIDGMRSRPEIIKIKEKYER